MMNYRQQQESEEQQFQTEKACPEVYRAINAVQKSISKIGIGKDRRNQIQNYNFRGIDDLYNALSPLLAEHGLCILPRCLKRECVERQSTKGGTLFYVTVEAEFDFVASADGSRHVVRMFGEAMDSGDKATPKAMSAAYKNAAFQAFAIPTEGDNDADAHTPEPLPGLPEHIIANHLAAIDAAADMESLSNAYKIAYRTAQNANDIDAAQKFTAAKDAQKAKLQ